MPSDTVSIAVDVPQPRVVGDRLAKVFTGRDWDLPSSVGGVGVEFVAFTGMLMPLPYTANWLTTTTGNYARLRKSQLSIAASSAWTEFERSYTGNWYVHSLNSNIPVQTSQSFERNRPMWLSWFNYNVGNETFVVMECGWGEDTDWEVSLRFWSDGNVEIFRNLEQVGSAKINEKSFYPSGLGPQQFDNGAPGKIMANETVDVVLIPGRRRELLVLSNQGGGFNFLFEDIDPNDPDPTITGPGPFWFQVPQGQATVQLAVLHFETEGYLLSPPFSFREPPNSGEPHTELISYDLPGYGTQSVEVSLRETNGTTLFVPDGDLQEARVRVDLQGDGDSTPFVHAATTAFDALTADSIDATFVLDDWWMQAELEVPEDPEGVSLRVTLNNPEEIEAAGATDLRGTGNRDIEAKLGAVTFFIGRTLDPEWDEGPSADTTDLILEARDRTIVQARYRIQDPEPMDGANFSNAIEFFARMPGFSATDMDIGFIDYSLPSIDANSAGGFALMPEVGDTPIQWIRKFHEEFAQTCFWGWVPTAEGVLFRFKKPEQLGTDSQITVYLTDAAAQADGRPYGDTHRWIYDWKPKVLQPEANDIYVVGRDPRSLLPIVGHFRDHASIDPTVAPPNRPPDWVGEIRAYSWVDPSLTREGDVAYALGNFADVLPRRRFVAQMRSQFLRRPDGAPLWRGDVLTVKGAGLLNGQPLDGKWRVKTLSTLFDLEYAHPTNALLDRIWRDTTYVIERERIQD